MSKHNTFPKSKTMFICRLLVWFILVTVGFLFQFSLASHPLEHSVRKLIIYNMINASNLNPSVGAEHLRRIIPIIVLQVIVGMIHVISGLILLLAPNMIPQPPFRTVRLKKKVNADVAYSVYTFLFGLLTVVFAGGLWIGNVLCWIGTVIISIFVVVIDVFAILNRPLIAGVPKLAGAGEIPYSLFVIIFLGQPHIRLIFNI